MTPLPDITAGGATSGAMANPTGIDVSAYQPHIDWRAVASAGHTFAIVKATEGAGYVSPIYRDQLWGARAAGLITGAYHFLRWEPGAPSAEAQAEHFAAVVGTLGPGDLPPALDVEWIKGQKRSASEIVAIVRAFLERVETLTHRWPMIYTGPSFWRFCLLPAGKPALELTSWPLWCCDYQPPLDPMQGAPEWTPTIHQHTGSGTCPGIAGHVDLNRFCGSLDELRLLACMGGT